MCDLLQLWAKLVRVGSKGGDAARPSKTTGPIYIWKMYGCNGEKTCALFKGKPSLFNTSAVFFLINLS